MDLAAAVALVKKGLTAAIWLAILLLFGGQAQKRNRSVGRWILIGVASSWGVYAAVVLGSIGLLQLTTDPATPRPREQVVDHLFWTFLLAYPISIVTMLLAAWFLHRLPPVPPPPGAAGSATPISSSGSAEGSPGHASEPQR